MKFFNIKESKIDGKGAFSNQYIPNNKIIGIAFKNLVENIPSYIDDYSQLELGKYINHSDQPNVKIIIDFKTFNLKYKAIKDINEDEEFTNDYNKFPWSGTNWNQLNESEIIQEFTLMELGIFITMIIGLITAIKVKYTNKSKMCHALKNIEDQKICKQRFKKQIILKQIQIINSNKNKCKQTKNPQKCLKKLEKLQRTLNKSLGE